MLRSAFAAASVLVIGCGPGLSAGVPAATEHYRVVHAYPHDPGAFTQGLLYQDGVLYESTGLQGHSSLRKVQLESGRVLQKIDVARPYFAEGLTSWGSELVQLTWVSHLAFVYDRQTFRREREFRYDGEGWGITHDSSSLIMSDGSDTLRYLDPVTFHVTRRVRVNDAGTPIANLNELEYIRGALYANVWQTDRVACIDPASGKVTAWLDLSGLLSDNERTPETDVLNGIAYDDAGDRLFVTGKRWPKLFEIKIQQ
jgi:glutaminyl-peptide cyclotransferase